MIKPRFNFNEKNNEDELSYLSSVILTQKKRIDYLENTVTRMAIDRGFLSLGDDVLLVRDAKAEEKAMLEWISEQTHEIVSRENNMEDTPYPRMLTLNRYWTGSVGKMTICVDYSPLSLNLAILNKAISCWNG